MVSPYSGCRLSVTFSFILPPATTTGSAGKLAVAGDYLLRPLPVLWGNWQWSMTVCRSTKSKKDLPLFSLNRIFGHFVPTYSCRSTKSKKICLCSRLIAYLVTSCPHIAAARQSQKKICLCSRLIAIFAPCKTWTGIGMSK